jgi:hypothetical protein
MRANQKLIPLEARAEWTAALQGIPHAFGHTWECCHALSLTAGLPTYLYCFEQGEARIVCPLWERDFDGEKDIVTPFGFSGFCGKNGGVDFPNQWSSFAHSRGYVCGYIGAHPLLWRESFARSEDVFEYNHIFVLNLSLDANRLLAGMARGRREQLRNWERSSARLFENVDELTEFFLRHQITCLTERGASRATYLSDETVRTLAAMEGVFLLGAGMGDEIQSVTIFIHSPTIADAWLNICVPAGRRHAAALLWHGALRLKSAGVAALNLGGGARENDGIATFKRHFGTQSLPMIALKQVYRPDMFEILCRGVNADPCARGGYFPPYRSS